MSDAPAPLDHPPDLPPDRAPATRPDDGWLRAPIELLVVLGIGILCARVFLAEAYIVPTGSMAPTLLGFHRDLACPGCGFRFPLGLNEEGRAGRAACPNCGRSDLAEADSAEGAGDRLLVHKFAFALRPPRRWEVAVFLSPEEPGQAFVKRVAGLPGESVEIRDGDLFIDGRPARKSLAEQRALRQIVYDQEFPPADADRYPRFVVRRADDGRALPSGWQADGRGFARQPRPDDAPDGPIDWLEYRHYLPDRQTTGPVHDFVAYNGVDDGGLNRVEDLMLVADVALGPDCPALVLRLGHRGDRFVVTVPVDGRTAPAVLRNDEAVTARGARPDRVAPAFRDGRAARLEASVFDRSLLVALDGEPLFDPIELDDNAAGPGGPAPRLALGVAAGSARVDGLQVYRDVYYTASLGSALRRPFGVDAPYRLGPGEYFVLGDNSAVSNDSRFWAGSPVVRADRFLGKPFLVHLPSRAMPLTLLGRLISWVPDPREIRYIR